MKRDFWAINIWAALWLLLPLFACSCCAAALWPNFCSKLPLQSAFSWAARPWSGFDNREGVNKETLFINRDVRPAINFHKKLWHENYLVLNSKPNI